MVAELTAPKEMRENVRPRTTAQTLTACQDRGLGRKIYPLLGEGQTADFLLLSIRNLPYPVK